MIVIVEIGLFCEREAGFLSQSMNVIHEVKTPHNSMGQSGFVLGANTCANQVLRRCTVYCVQYLHKR